MVGDFDFNKNPLGLGFRLRVFSKPVEVVNANTTKIIPHKSTQQTKMSEVAGWGIISNFERNIYP